MKDGDGQVEKALRIILLLLAFAPLFAADKPSAPRQWRMGVVQSLTVGFGSVIEITSDDVIYKMELITPMKKKDSIPFSGLVTMTRRIARDHLDVAVGAPVKFAIEKKTVWLVDDNGAERRLSLKSERLATK